VPGILRVQGQTPLGGGGGDKRVWYHQPVAQVLRSHPLMSQLGGCRGHG
jgi:hypothetical protein